MLLKIIKWFVLVLFGAVVVIFLLLSVNSITSTSSKPSHSHWVESFDGSRDGNESLSNRELEFGKEKEIPAQYKEQILMALSHFPELRGTSIKFTIDEANFPLQSRPSFYSLLLPSVERKYNIIISNKSMPEYGALLLAKIPWKGQIGVLGHELAHVAYYENIPSLKIALIGIKYFFSARFRNEFERMTDLITIEHGLGDCLLNWRKYYEDLLKRSEQLSFNQKIYFEDRYLTASEIKQHMNKK